MSHLLFWVPSLSYIDNQCNIWNRISRIVRGLILCHTQDGDMVLGEEKMKWAMISSFLQLFCGQNNFWTRVDKWEIQGNYQKVILGKYLSSYYFLIIFKSFLFCYSYANFPPLPSFTYPIPRSHSQSPHCCHIHGLYIHVFCLVPSPSFHHCSPPPSPLVTFILLHIPMPVGLFCSVYFVQ